MAHHLYALTADKFRWSQLSVGAKQKETRVYVYLDKSQYAWKYL